MSETYYISDLHFGHANVLSYDNRPFCDIDSHDETIISNWNSVVNPEDDVWILGDFSWYPAGKTIEIYKRLNGKKHLVIGNHDKKLLRNREVKELFVETVDYKEIRIDSSTGVVLCHYPIPCFNNHYRKWIHLYGHVHNSFEWNMMEHTRRQMEKLYDVPCRMYNVGCMMSYIDYKPRTIEEILRHYEGCDE